MALITSDCLQAQLDQGMVLVMSLWDDHAVDMLWLDSVRPPAFPTAVFTRPMTFP